MTNLYGTHETNPIQKGYHNNYHNVPTVDWTDRRLSKITRLRLLSDPGFPVWDVSYCHGMLKDGTLCRVQVPFSQLPKRNMMKVIIESGKRDGVFAKGLGVFEAISTLI
jgi:hypothetical protein